MIRNKVAVSGQYRLIKRNIAGEITGDTGWFDNLITDIGLNRMGTGSAIERCEIGTGTTTPVFTDTSLATFAAATTSRIGSVHTVAPSTPYYHQTDVTFRFAIGTLNGNYSEIGVGWSLGFLFSRALILDGGGSPTTITVNITEQLDVVYRVRTYFPETDATSSVTISGTSYTITRRVGLIASNYSNAYGGTGLIAVRPIRYAAYIHNGSIGTIFGYPSGTQIGISSSSTYVSAYVNNSLEQYGGFNLTTGEGNMAGGISAVQIVPEGVGGFMVQYGISPAIPKDSSKTLNLAFKCSWARH